MYSPNFNWDLKTNSLQFFKGISEEERKHRFKKNKISTQVIFLAWIIEVLEAYVNICIYIGGNPVVILKTCLVVLITFLTHLLNQVGR